MSREFPLTVLGVAARFTSATGIHRTATETGRISDTARMSTW
ncbi:hypothetical protein ABFT51_17635 [Paenibacillus peoriae]